MAIKMSQSREHRGAAHFEVDLEAARAEGDQAADQVVTSLSAYELSRCWAVLREWEENSEPVPSTLPGIVKEFFEESAALPSWVDADKIQEVHRLYSRYPADLLAMLLYAALPECYAAADGASLLAQTTNWSDRRDLDF